MGGNAQPFDFHQALQATRKAAEAQKQAENDRRVAAEEHAEAERQYRRALAQKIVELHAEGKAWTVVRDLARGDEKVGELRYRRDVAKGVLDAAEQRAWRHTADRRDMNEFIQWSRIVAPLGQTQEPARLDPPIGGRR